MPYVRTAASTRRSPLAPERCSARRLGQRRNHVRDSGKMRERGVSGLRARIRPRRVAPAGRRTWNDPRQTTACAHRFASHPLISAATSGLGIDFSRGPGGRDKALSMSTLHFGPAGARLFLSRASPGSARPPCRTGPARHADRLVGEEESLMTETLACLRGLLRRQRLLRLNREGQGSSPLN